MLSVADSNGKGDIWVATETNWLEIDGLTPTRPNSKYVEYFTLMQGVELCFDPGEEIQVTCLPAFFSSCTFDTDPYTFIIKVGTTNDLLFNATQTAVMQPPA